MGSLTVRPTALMIPSVALLWNPRGLPIASTMSPTSSCEELAKVAGCSPVASMWITAKSSGEKLLTSVPGYSLPLARVTENDLYPSATWLLVTMSPAVLKMIPEPRSTLVEIWTTEGLTSL